MKTSENVDTNIFRSNSQLLHGIDPANIKPIWDRLLIRDLPDPNRIGSIWIPETAAERGVGKDGLLRLGVVVAVGPGDKFSKEWIEKDRLTGQSQVMRKALGKCSYCLGHGRVSFSLMGGDGPLQDRMCPKCHGGGIRRWPMYCKVGDKILYDRRKEAELFINGERYSLLYELQAVMAILES